MNTQPQKLSAKDLTLEERETHINQTADNRNTWTIYTDDAVMTTRLDKIVEARANNEVTREAQGIGFSYTLPANYVRIRAPRILSSEQRDRLKKQLAKGRETQKANNV